MSTIATMQPQKSIVGSTNEPAYSERLQNVVNKIQAASDVDEIVLEVSKDVCTILNADRFTIFLLSDDKSSFISRVNTGFDSFQELKQPVTENSIIGCAL